MRLGEGLAHSPDAPDPYVVHAAIAACHALAPTAEQTDWSAIVSCYDVLLGIQPTSIVALNRAVALGERDGAAAALAAIEAIEDLASYPLWHATRAESSTASAAMPGRRRARRCAGPCRSRRRSVVSWSSASPTWPADVPAPTGSSPPVISR